MKKASEIFIWFLMQLTDYKESTKSNSNIIEWHDREESRVEDCGNRGNICWETIDRGIYLMGRRVHREEK